MEHTLAKKRRTEKQKAATRKLVALNKRKSSKRTPKKRSKSTTKRRKSQPLRSTKPRKSMAKRRSYKRSSSKIGNIFNKGTIGKVVAGVGAAALVGAVLDRFLPNSPITSIAKPIAAYAGGGAAGAIGSVVLDGGLNTIGSIFGMQSNSTNQTASGGFSV